MAYSDSSGPNVVDYVQLSYLSGLGYRCTIGGDCVG